MPPSNQKKSFKASKKPKPHNRTADLGAAGIYYRALVGPFASAGKAAKLCSGLKAAGGDCVIHEKLTSALTHHAPDGGAAEAPAMRGMEGDAMKSTLHKERATKSRKSRKWFFGPVKEEYV